MTRLRDTQPRFEAGGMTLEHLVELLTSLEADLRAYRAFCDPHPLGRNVSECILEALDPAIDNLFQARQLFGCDPTEPTVGIDFMYRDFEFLDSVRERSAAIAEEGLAMRNDDIACALGAIDELRSTFHSAWKYAEEIEGGYEDEDEDEEIEAV
jgi:hypothetical protein